MKIERKKIKGEECGDKRQNLPFVFRDTCPECGAEATFDATIDYLSYPVFGPPGEPIRFGCYACEHEWERIVLIGFTCEAKP